MGDFTIVGLCGSLRQGSFNMAALRAAADLVPEGVTIEIAGIGDIPLYDDDVRARGMPDAVLALSSRIAAADAVLIATPEYNYSIPGVLKNTIDWLSRCEPQPFKGKPVAIMGASPGMIGTARAHYDLRKVFVFLDAYELNKPEIMIGGAAQKFDGGGVLVDPMTRQFIGQQIVALRDWARRLQG